MITEDNLILFVDCIIESLKEGTVKSIVSKQKYRDNIKVNIKKHIRLILKKKCIMKFLVNDAEILPHSEYSGKIVVRDNCSPRDKYKMEWTTNEELREILFNIKYKINEV